MLYYPFIQFAPILDHSDEIKIIYTQTKKWLNGEKEKEKKKKKETLCNCEKHSKTKKKSNTCVWTHILITVLVKTIWLRAALN